MFKSKHKKKKLSVLVLTGRDVVGLLGPEAWHKAGGLKGVNVHATVGADERWQHEIGSGEQPLVWKSWVT